MVCKYLHMMFGDTKGLMLWQSVGKLRVLPGLPHGHGTLSLKLLNHDSSPHLWITPLQAPQVSDQTFYSLERAHVPSGPVSHNCTHQTDVVLVHCMEAPA